MDDILEFFESLEGVKVTNALPNNSSCYVLYLAVTIDGNSTKLSEIGGSLTPEIGFSGSLSLGTGINGKFMYKNVLAPQFAVINPGDSEIVKFDGSNVGFNFQVIILGLYRFSF
jgi:hypothetical protein